MHRDGETRERLRQRYRLRTVIGMLLGEGTSKLSRRSFARHLEAVWRSSSSKALGQHFQGCPEVADSWWHIVCAESAPADSVSSEALLMAVEACNSSDDAIRSDWLWRTLGPGPVETLVAAFTLDTGAPPTTIEPFHSAAAALGPDVDSRAFARWSARTLPLLSHVLATHVVHWFASSDAVEAARQAAEERERERNEPPSLEKLLSLGPDTLRRWLRSSSSREIPSAEGSETAEARSVWAAPPAPAEAGSVSVARVEDESADASASTAADSCTAAGAGTAPPEASRAGADADTPVLCREWQWLLSLALDIDCLGWTRLFSSNHHGRSLHMLAQRTALYRGGVLVVAREASGATHAGFAANGLLAPRDAAHGVYFGNEACCLLRLTPALQVCRAKALGPAGVGGAAAAADCAAGLGPRSAGAMGRNFCYLNNKRGVRRGLGFGGTLACPRIWLDPSLEHGTGSAACETYADGLLSSESEFNVDRVEVWGTGGEAAEKEQLERQDARDEHRRRTARSFLLREKNDMGATKLAESDSWIVSLLGGGRGRDYM